MVLSATQAKYETGLTVTQSGTTQLTITVAYAGGPIVCHPAVKAPPGTLAPDVAATVDVEVQIGFLTDDGLFDERFAANITGSSSGSATFSHTMSATDLDGTFDPNLADYSNVTVSFTGTFAGATTHGSVGKAGQRPGFAPESFPFVATWGS